MPLSRIYITIFTLLVSVALGQQLQAEEAPQHSWQDLARSLRCTVCEAQNLYESNSQIARDLKKYIQAELAAGKTPDEVKLQLRLNYGQYIDLRPKFDATTYLLWLTPLLALIILGRMYYSYLHKK